MPAILGFAAAQAGNLDSLPLRDGDILPDPDFSLLRPKDPYLIGIRPHRAGGVRLELEQEPIASPWGPKFLIHNYGHGGAGITLSFGCASVVADHVRTLLRDMGRRRHISVAVIGSGVIGLTVASELRRRWPRLRITVYAKELDVRRTTSFKAAGQFEPSGIHEEYETDEGRSILADYLRRSRNRIIELGDASRWVHYGIAFRRNYTLDHPVPGFDTHTPVDVVPKPRTGTLPFHSLNVPGREYRTWLINPTILLPRLFLDLKLSGVPFRRRMFSDVRSFAELRENIIINCTGYGAKALVQDDQMLARRGHLVVLRRTLAKQFYFFSGGCANYRTMYVFCRQKDIVIGGSVQDGKESESASSDDDGMFRQILENARNVFDGRPQQCRWRPRLAGHAGHPD
jgi:glycine/D-amino acid oxidase-like deaminating enzyme